MGFPEKQYSFSHLLATNFFKASKSFKKNQQGLLLKRFML